MKLEIPADKAVSDSQPAQVMEISQIVPAKKSNNLTKKHLLIAGVTLLAVILVVTCVLVAVRLVTNTQKEIFMFKTSAKNTDQTNETRSVSIGENDNSVIYHIQQANANITYVDDFNRNVRVTKIQSINGVVCYASILNRSVAVQPRDIPTAAPSLSPNSSSEAVQYKPLPDPIVDITFLGYRVQNMCNNIPTYWEQLACVGDVSAVSRQKRATCLLVRVWYICRVGWQYYWCYRFEWRCYW